MSNIAGLRIGHDALEQALAGHGIEAAVVGDDRSVLAVYSTAHAEGEVRRLLVAANGLAPFHIKAKAVDVLPRLDTGKLDYERLRAELADQPSRRPARSEERRVGKEGVSTCRSRGSPDQYKKTK